MELLHTGVLVYLGQLQPEFSCLGSLSDLLLLLRYLLLCGWIKRGKDPVPYLHMVLLLLQYGQ